MRSGDNLTVNPPLPLETLESYARDIFTPIMRGESTTSIWVPMAGRRIINKFIIAYPHYFKKQLEDIEKYILVYIEPLELTDESNSGYLKLISRSIIEEIKKKSERSLSKEESYYYSSDNYSDDLSRLEELILEVSRFEFKIILFLGEFDELQFANQMLYNNLKSLWVHVDRNIQYIFLVKEDVTRPELIKKFGELNELILKNVVYVPLLKEKDTDYVLDFFVSILNHEFTKDERELLKEVCGGHPYLIKSCSRLIALMRGGKLDPTHLAKYLIDHFEPRSACQKIYDLLIDEDKNLLKQIVSSKIKDLPASASYLVRLSLIKNIDDYWYPFGSLFASVIVADGQNKNLTAIKPSELIFEEKNGAIFIKGESVEDKFTRQEYEIIRFLLSDSTKLRSRDEIGEAMWGKQSYEKYSDWAIDQVMSKIRKKLKTLGAEKALSTVRGRGYKLTI